MHDHFSYIADARKKSLLYNYSMVILLFFYFILFSDWEWDGSLLKCKGGPYLNGIVKEREKKKIPFAFVKDPDRQSVVFAKIGLLNFILPNKKQKK